jgi:putative oxidoreductase
MQTTYVFPQLATFYATLGPWAEALLRVLVGALLIPHALRNLLGWWPNSGSPVKSLDEFFSLLEQIGYRPGVLWGWLVLLTELVAGPLLILGLFTRPAAVPILILMLLSVRTHKMFGWFWNQQGIEYPVLWSAAVLYFLLNGGGAISLDAWLGWQF